MKGWGYWGTTGLLSLALLGSGLANLTQAEEVVRSIEGLGFPPYLTWILGTWKLLAVVALLAPGMARVKEWAYAGIGFAMTGAAVSHLAAGDPVFAAAPSLVLLSLAVASYLLRPPGRTMEATLATDGASRSAVAASAA